MTHSTFKNSIFLLIVLLLAFLKTNAQYRIYEKGQQQWNICLGSAYSNYHKTSVFYSGNQQVSYGGLIYKLLYVNSGDIMQYEYAIYREDNGKVYMIELNRSTNNRQEYLIYDWTMDIGDVVYVRYGEAMRGLVLDQITDTVLNGIDRKVFHLHYETNPDISEIWIEGVGSELGFPFSGTKDNPESMIVDAELLCYYEDGVQIWDNPNYDDCEISYWNVQENTCDKVGVYPNPTQGVTTIKLTGQGNNTVVVYDIMGRVIMKRTEKGDCLDIDLTYFPNGVYNIVIYDNESIYQTKIVKQYIK